MYLHKFVIKPVLSVVVALTFFNCAIAQENKVAPTSQELYNEIAKMDSIIFAAFNTQNMVKFQPMFTKDLEWFQDNGVYFLIKQYLKTLVIILKSHLN